MSIMKKRIIRLIMHGFDYLNELADPAFIEELHSLKQKHPMSSRPTRIIRKYMKVKKCVVGGGIYYMAADRKNRSNKKVLFIHGGGFAAEALPMHWAFCRRLSRDTGCEIIFPQYPLVPESDSENTHKMLVEVYKEVIKRCRPEDLTIIGDSAGGTLSLSLSMIARDIGLPVANEIVLISPGFIIGPLSERDERRLEYIRRKDFILGNFPVDKISRLWRGDLSVNDYRADVTKGRLKGLPHITMFSGTHDIMNVPGRKFVTKMRKEGHPFDYHEKKCGAHEYALSRKNTKEYGIIVSVVKGEALSFAE